MKWQAGLFSDGDLLNYHETPPRYTAGFAIGIIAVDLIYPKLPGNVANATTYSFPVLYKKVSFEIEKLFAGDESIKQMIIDAARELEAQGVRAIVGACGYFAHFQEDVANAVDVPVFLSSLCQLPFIKLGLRKTQKIAVVAASGDNIDDNLLKKVGTDMDRLDIINVGGLKSFAGIRYGKTGFDNDKLTSDLCGILEEHVSKNRDTGAILLECSDLPPYARAIQAVTGLPVFDFNSMIDLIYHGVVQKPYFGYF